MEAKPAIGWFEIHSENYFGAGGPPLHYLERVRAEYPISLHGVGLSLGSADLLNPEHLRHLKNLVDRFAPGLVSEHLCWSSIGGRYLNDLVPLPYTEEALGHVAARVSEVQEILGRRILVENVSSYLEYLESSIPEWEFLREVARRAGCGILLDVNNLYVSARNHGFDPRQFVQRIPGGLVGEIHLAGFTVNRFEDGELLIDTHDHPVAEEVWRLYALAIERFGPKPALIEWDTDLPPLEALVAEADSKITAALEFLSPAVDLLLRLWVANVFFKAGLTKIQSWESTVLLFTYEYSVPLLSPEIAAALGAVTELFFPVLLVLGRSKRSRRASAELSLGGAQL